MLDKKISVHDESINVIDENLSVILYVNRPHKYIEIKKNFGIKRIAFSDIDFIFLEYHNLYFHTLKGLFLHANYFDKQLWKNSIALVLNSGKIISLFEAQLNQTFYQQSIENTGDTAITDENYLHYGEKVIRVLSYTIQKEYLIINYPE